MKTDVLTTLTTREACIVAEFRLEDVIVDLGGLQELCNELLSISYVIKTVEENAQ